MSGIDTPSRPAAHLRTSSSSGSLSGSLNAAAMPTPPSPSIGGFSPGAPMPQGFSYLTRSHSLVTPTRRQLPQGMSTGNSQSPTPAKQLPPLPSSASATDVARDSMLKRSRTVHDVRPAPVPSPIPSLPSPETPARTLHRTRSEASNLAAMVAQLPSNPKQWTPSQVALYLAHVLGLTPRPIVEDVTAYVRQSGMSGRAFLRLREADLEAEGLNLKWRRLMIEAVRKLRRDCLKGRIWGFEGGSMEWPREADVEEHEEIPAAKPSPAYAKGTLKRMREKKRVRQMIETFEGSADEYEHDDTELRAEARDAIARRSSSGGSVGTPSPRQPMAPIYGEGYVRQRAESFSNGGATEVPSRPELTQAQLEEWFGTMSEQEAAAAASELDEEELLALDEDLVELAFEERQRARRASEDESHDRSGSGSSILSVDSLEQGPLTPPPLKFNPLEADLISAIVGEENGDGSPTAKKGGGSNELPALGLGLQAMAVSVPAPATTLVITDDVAETGHLRSRPGSNGSAGRPVNPYRSSTYEPADLEALGLDEVEDCKFSTARRIPLREQENGVVLENRARDLFAGSAALTTGSIRGRPLPVPPVEDGESDTADSDQLTTLASLPVDISVATRQSTLSKGSKRSAQLAAILRASGVAEGAAASSAPGSVGRAFDGTMSRKGSRMGTMSKRSGPPPSAGRAASRMLELFSPAGSEVNSPATDGHAFEAPPPSDKIAVPLTTLEPTSDGQGSIRKRSMVLVDRKRFEELAKRMGALEEQLKVLESVADGASSVASRDEIGEADDKDLEIADALIAASESDKAVKPSGHTKMRTALDDVFAYPQSDVSLRRQRENEARFEEELRQAAEDKGGRSLFGIPLSLGAIPAYALGLGAGIGFVVVSEVLGRAARR